MAEIVCSQQSVPDEIIDVLMAKHFSLAALAGEAMCNRSVDLRSAWACVWLAEIENQTKANCDPD